MRSRYSAYVLRLDDYVLQTWHPQTRPLSLSLADDATKWLGLNVKRHETAGDAATVEFVARFRINGRGARMHEVSEFVYEDGRWFYVRGVVS